MYMYMHHTQYTCMYACAYVHVYINAYVHVHVYINAYVHVHVYINANAHVHVYTCTFAHTKNKFVSLDRCCIVGANHKPDAVIRSEVNPPLNYYSLVIQ